MVTLLLIRHGESQANRKDIFAGHLDIDLEDKGLEQAKLTAQYIKENYSPHKVYSSDLKRAYRTGKCVADLLGIEIELNKNLREIDAGEWDDKTFDELAKVYNKAYDLWLNDIGNAVCTGGESVKHLGERVMSALTEIAEENEGKTVVIATHATPVRASQTLIQYGTLEEMKNVEWASNASVTVYEYDNGSWKCVEASHDAHLGDIITALPENI